MSVRRDNIATPSVTPAIKELLGRTVRCTLSDGRTATGTLLCVDRLRNLILTSVLEERTIDPLHYAAPRESNGSHNHNDVSNYCVNRKLSQAMVPGKHLVKVEITKTLYDAVLLQHLHHPKQQQQEDQR